jgi:hypothetical protein
MKKYLNYVKSDLKPALKHLPSPKTFGLLYGDGFREGDLSGVPVKSLAEWMEIDLTALPPSDRLSEEQQIQMAATLLKYWTKTDELAHAIRFAQPKRRYEAAIEYLNLRGQYDGLGGFLLEDTPIPPEEFKKIVSPLDSLMGLDKDAETSGWEDDGFPF